jgi:hypothetical protein
MSIELSVILVFTCIYFRFIQLITLDITRSEAEIPHPSRLFHALLFGFPVRLLNKRRFHRITGLPTHGSAHLAHLSAPEGGLFYTAVLR